MSETVAARRSVSTGESSGPELGRPRGGGGGHGAGRAPSTQLALARLVVWIGEARLARLERGLPRRVVLRAVPIVLRLRFARRRAGDLRARIEFRWLDPAGGLPQHLEVTIGDGHCRTRRHASARPTSVMSVGVADLLRMSAGVASTPMLVQQGRMRLNGDLFTIMRLPELFGLPERPLV